MTNENENTGRGYQYSDEELLNFIREVHDEHGKATIDLYNQQDDVAASSVIIERFGSWVEAKQKAGVGGDGRQNNARPREYTTEEMLDMLRQCEERHGSASQSNFDSDDDFCSSGAIVKRFGQWSTAKSEAGVA